MRLAAFIRANMKPIVSEWESFAQSLIPAEGMSPISLRNHIREMLAFVCSDIESDQTDAEQIEKSHGDKPMALTHSAAEIHASLREAGGFNIDQMVSEYRALRASIIKLWESQLTDVTSVDVSDLIRFNEAIDQTMMESIKYYSQKLDISRNMFLGILSHDLRNPLGSVRMSAALAMNLGTLNERQTMLLSQIVDSVDRATEIVSHLLDLTRARLGSGFPIVKEHMDMGFVSRKMVDEMRAMHPNRTFTLDVSGDTEGDWDKARIGQVFSNLLGNAVQYGFKDVPIGIAIEGCSEEVKLSVHNEGVPVAPDALTRIFEALTRGVPEGSEKEPTSTNFGLGLYITKEIVTAHGGAIDVTSSEKDGTTFTARFPRMSAAA
jgi:signal transduction histidine kinase